MSYAPGDLWLISAPNEGSPQETWDKLCRATGNMSVNNKLSIPDLKVLNLKKLTEIYTVFKSLFCSIVSIFIWLDCKIP